MTTASAPASRTDAPHATGRRAAATRALLPMSLAATLWWWIVPLAALTVLTLADPAWIADADISLWQITLYAPEVVSFILGVTVAAIQLPLFVANGIDRRTCFRAAALALVPGVVGCALLTAAGFAIERATLVPRGLEPSLFQPHLFATTDQYLLVGTAVVIGMAIAWLTGWLIALGFYRFGWWRGTLAVLPALVPAIATEALLGGPVLAGLDLGFAPAGRAMLSIAIIGAVWAVAAHLTSGAELRGTSTWMVAG